MINESLALRFAKSQQTGFAVGTIAYACGVLVLYWLSIHAAISGAMPLWLVLITNTLLVYCAYTPVHEAAHGNITYDKGRWGWVNPLVGIMCTFPMLHNYSLHRTTHLAHHMHTYDPAHDADHWVKGSNAFTTALRCLTIVLSHYRMGWIINKGTAKGRQTIAIGIIQNIFTLLPPIWLIAVGLWPVAVMAIILPAVLGSGLLGFLFDYVVHYPKIANDRFRRGRIYRMPALIEPVVTVLYACQNFHQIHHLYPWVPFYRYPRVFREVEPLLIEKGTPIVRIGGPAST
jgi:beta-carotene hydroxylase